VGKLSPTSPGISSTQFSQRNWLKSSSKKREIRFLTFDLTAEPLMDVNDIMNILPHRPPFLLVDKILELSETHIVGLKSVTMNEPYFVGHFPGQPVMPGVLQIEAMAQAGGVLVLNTVPDPENYLTFFMKIENAKFKNPVVPGDTLVFKMELLSPITKRNLPHACGSIFQRKNNN
jgi:UDP-3-O-[3-hydroxymyristoyl] N-acetylglucosamine deacetylase/3-hydroxyacyl-[acyl-carrier-protein] dehydratase